VRALFFIAILVILGSFKIGSENFDAPAKIENRPKNIILMIGDGMGLPQVSAGFIKNGWHFSLEDFPVVGFQKTYSADNLVTDSAAGATAMACGKKTKNNMLGLTPDGNPCQSILEEASMSGYATGMVVTSSIQHATPGGFVAHRQARNMYEDITLDILASNLDFFVGGGRQYFDNRENDDQDLLAALKNKGFSVYDKNTNSLENLRPDPNHKIAFFTAENQPTSAIQGRDYLPDAAQFALNYLQKRSENGFFLMVEGSQIDWSCHANQIDPLYSELADFDKTIKQVLQFARTNGETLVIVTADHETGGLGLNEGTARMVSPKFTTNGHTAAMVPVFAFGPKSELFRGIYENTEIHHKMRQAFGF